MATSTALTNSDILCLIFEYFIPRPLEDGAYTKETRADLARAARVCVAFHEPAVRLLWKDLTSFVTLLRCLPSSLVRVKRGKRNSIYWDTYMLNGYVVPQEWERMRRHAECVETLDLRGSTDELGLATWAYLSHLTQDRPLLPNLRRLGCHFDSPQSTLMMPHLLSPSLTHLSIGCTLPGSAGSEWECSLRSFFHVVGSVAMQLSHVEIYTSSGRQFVPVALTILSPIRQLQFLRSVVLSWSTTSPFSDILALQSVMSGMKSLEVLELTSHLAPNLGAKPKLGMPLPRCPVTNLQELCISFDKPRSMNDELYKCLDCPHLRKLHDISKDLSLEKGIIARVSNIARRFPRLQVLSLTFEEYRGEDFSLGSIVPSLSTLRSITSFKLYIPTDWEMPGATTDADIHALANAWPLLTTLSIYADAPASVGPAALVSLATRCPKLEVLDLPSLCILEDDLSSLAADYPILDHSLQTISFQRLDVADCKYAASLLDRLFPRLCIRRSAPPSFAHMRRFDGRPSPLYDQVQAQLEIVQAARRQQ